ncbi:ribonucleotide reductase of class III, large subunit [Pectobacterium phage Arno162]|uniref:Ribonucleotide reductase of class III, large subunit n=1 Tax=Pectobacterium phage Arno162 TaxID=2500577 RepID=A0A679A2N9_9CAUD|nr:ribonucleotide reductase of class III, large subunit [Pectobacterium phage Arno162]
MSIRVIKKTGFEQQWDFEKIRIAVGKSCKRANVMPPENFWGELETLVGLALLDDNEVTVDALHNIVETSLKKLDERIYDAYANYRNYKKDFVHSWEEIFTKSRDTLYIGDKENANFDSSLSSTKGSIIRGFLTKELYRRNSLSKDEIQAIEDGYIYIHDLRDLIFGGINCCLFDIGKVLDGGFEMSSIQYKEPRSVLSALQVIGDITLAATAQQFGGFTLAELDKVLVKYYKMSYEHHLQEGIAWGVNDATQYAYAKTQEELMQGFQSMEMKLNTVPCSRGDFAFTTISFGNLDNEQDRFIQGLIADAILTVRMKGQGKNHKPVVFPKLVYLHNKNLHDTSETQRALFNTAIECNTKAMYPDFLDITQQGYVARIYNETGKVISPMGCRAYLSDFKDANGESVFVGRANIGAVSLNLPMIWMKAEQAGTPFWDEVEKWMQMAREFLKKRYEQVAHSRCSTNPLAFTQGGLYLGNKDPDEKIGFDIVKSFTASFGITALNELCVLMNGCHIEECQEGLDTTPADVLARIDGIIARFRKEDGYLYAMYGTPAESLCSTQVNQFKEKYGVIAGVSDREYFTNSFHVHVSTEISPAEKQDFEHDAFHICNGGHIIYSRIANPENKKAIAAIVNRGMQAGYYQGVNFDLAICECCGHRPKSTEKCDACGSEDISVINRVCGYLGFSKVKGSTRMNEGKMAEIRDRKCM